MPLTNYPPYDAIDSITNAPPLYHDDTLLSQSLNSRSILGNYKLGAQLLPSGTSRHAAVAANLSSLLMGINRSAISGLMAANKLGGAVLSAACLVVISGAERRLDYVRPGSLFVSHMRDMDRTPASGSGVNGGQHFNSASENRRRRRAHGETTAVHCMKSGLMAGQQRFNV